MRQATALVHEAYLRLDGTTAACTDRNHFIGIATGARCGTRTFRGDRSGAGAHHRVALLRRLEERGRGERARPVARHAEAPLRADSCLVGPRIRWRARMPPEQWRRGRDRGERCVDLPRPDAGAFLVRRARGHGGMWRVDLTTDTRLGREVALKLLGRAAAARPQARGHHPRQQRHAEDPRLRSGACRRGCGRRGGAEDDLAGHARRHPGLHGASATERGQPRWPYQPDRCGRLAAHARAGDDRSGVRSGLTNDQRPTTNDQRPMTT